MHLSEPTSQRVIGRIVPALSWRARAAVERILSLRGPTTLWRDIVAERAMARAIRRAALDE